MTDRNRSVSVLGDNAALLTRRNAITEEQLNMTSLLLAEAIMQSDEVRSAEDAYLEFCRVYKNADGRARAIACREIVGNERFSKQIAQKGLLGYGEMALPGTHGRIAYVRNKRNDDAFARFSERIRGAKAQYCSSFSETCEAVFGNACEFCILPIESDTDGKLYSFYSMIDRYELIITDVVYVASDDDAHSTCFALVSRGVNPKGRPHSVRFEFSVVCEDGTFPHDIAAVVRYMGGRLLSVGTQPVPYDDVGTKYYFSIDIDGSNILPMAFYMSMEYPRYTPLGAYSVKK